jgi:hypothetical protein
MLMWSTNRTLKINIAETLDVLLDTSQLSAVSILLETPLVGHLSIYAAALVLY